MKELLSGNEALARGALEAGIEIACGYPGTPSSEILENVAKYKEIYSEWSVNEKVAMDAAAGAAYSGRRSMVTTKQVGMNVLSDSLFYTAYTGAEAAFVVITADDPGLFSSQNEQDNRHYAKLGKFPMLEPCDSQECKDFMGEAVAISERFDTPVVIRTTMRTSHSKSVVELGEPASYGKQVGPFPRNMEKYNCMYTWARERHYVLEQRLLDLEAFSNEWPGNAIHWGDREYGFIAGGILYEGGTMGDLYINRELRTDLNGNIYVDPQTNKVELTTTERRKVASLLPKGNIGWSNSFAWKGLNLNVMFAARLGGSVVSNTEAFLDYYGVSERSAAAREAGGVRINNGMVDAQNYYQTIGAGTGAGAYYIYDATNVRMQELSLAYTLPKRWFRQKMAMTVSLVGRNLWMIYNKAPFDPELTPSTADNFLQGVDYFMLPSLRNIGFTVKLQF